MNEEFYVKKKMMSASVAKISAQLTTDAKYLFIQYSGGIVGWAWVWGVSTEQARFQQHQYRESVLLRVGVGAGGR